MLITLTHRLFANILFTYNSYNILLKPLSKYVLHKL